MSMVTVPAEILIQHMSLEKVLEYAVWREEEPPTEPSGEPPETVAMRAVAPTMPSRR